MEKKIRDAYNDELLHEALRRYGIRPGTITLLDGFESFIYRCTLADGNEGILRISHNLHRGAPAIRGEVDWLAYLAEHGVSVAHAVPSRGGELVEVLGDGGSYFSAAAFILAPGKPPERADWENGLMVRVGQLIGRMNTLAQGYAPRDPNGDRPSIFQDLEGFERFLPPAEEPVAKKWRLLLEILRGLPVDPGSYGLVHQDVHGGNFFVQDGQITLFDFDDCLYAWFAYDVAMALFYVLPVDGAGPEHLAFTRHAFAELMEGYTRERPLSPFWVSQIPMFLKLREIDLYIAIHRSMDLDQLDPWCTRFMANRREKILHDVPFVDGLLA